jgi:hypothetical protein
MSIVELKTRSAQVVASVVMRLEEVLQDAREGKISAVAIAAVETGGALITTWSETDDFGRLLGAVSRLEYRLNDNQPTREVV